MPKKMSKNVIISPNFHKNVKKVVAVDVGRANFGPNFEEKSAMRGARETGVVPLGRPPGGLPM